MNKEDVLEEVKDYQDMRKYGAEYGDVGAVQKANYELSKLAKKLGVDYYTL